jgi:hypothetical protein
VLHATGTRGGEMPETVPWEVVPWPLLRLCVSVRVEGAALDLTGHPRSTIRLPSETQKTDPCGNETTSAEAEWGREQSSSAACWNCGKPALPALLGRGANLAGFSGFWVGHSSKCFAAELLLDREPGLVARLPGIYSRKAVSRPTPLIGRRPLAGGPVGVAGRDTWPNT